jgi:hypothetical protein
MVSIEYPCGLKYFRLTFAFQILGKPLIKFHRTEQGTRDLTYEPRVRDRSIPKYFNSTNCTNEYVTQMCLWLPNDNLVYIICLCIGSTSLIPNCR